MRKVMFFLFLVCIGLFNAGSSYSFADYEVASIKNSLSRWLCFERYWEWPIDRPSSILPMRIKSDDNTFRIWINNLEVTKESHMAGYFIGRIRNGHAAIISREAYNINLTPPVPGYVKNKKLFEHDSVIEDVLIMPSDCSPHYDQPTPQKELMLQTAVSTMQKRLSEFAKMGIAKYPKELTLIIADFNIDYPSTYILVDQTKEVYSVTLHDPQNYDSDEYERSGEYPFGELYNKSKTLLEKIRKHGIVRKIVLTQ